MRTKPEKKSSTGNLVRPPVVATIWPIWFSSTTVAGSPDVAYAPPPGRHQTA
jgi:hypothetical protein